MIAHDSSGYRSPRSYGAINGLRYFVTRFSRSANCMSARTRRPIQHAGAAPGG